MRERAVRAQVPFDASVSLPKKKAVSVCLDICMQIYAHLCIFTGLKCTCGFIHIISCTDCILNVYSFIHKAFTNSLPPPHHSPVPLMWL